MGGEGGDGVAMLRCRLSRRWLISWFSSPAWNAWVSPQGRLNFDAAKYGDLLRVMDNITLEELIMTVRRQSPSPLPDAAPLQAAHPPAPLCLGGAAAGVLSGHQQLQGGDQAPQRALGEQDWRARWGRCILHIIIAAAASCMLLTVSRT